ncbi:MAG: hypothetical protein Q9184_006018 [Pyrenodesmia sp. 2 TL-2023]
MRSDDAGQSAIIQSYKRNLAAANKNGVELRRQRALLPERVRYLEAQLEVAQSTTEAEPTTSEGMVLDPGHTVPGSGQQEKVNTSQERIDKGGSKPPLHSLAVPIQNTMEGSTPSESIVLDTDYTVPGSSRKARVNVGQERLSNGRARLPSPLTAPLQNTIAETAPSESMALDPGQQDETNVDQENLNSGGGTPSAAVSIYNPTRAEQTATEGVQATTRAEQTSREGAIRHTGYTVSCSSRQDEINVGQEVVESRRESSLGVTHLLIVVHGLRLTKPTGGEMLANGVVELPFDRDQTKKRRIACRCPTLAGSRA